MFYVYIQYLYIWVHSFTQASYGKPSFSLWLSDQVCVCSHGKSASGVLTFVSVRKLQRRYQKKISKLIFEHNLRMFSYKTESICHSKAQGWAMWGIDISMWNWMECVLLILLFVCSFFLCSTWRRRWNDRDQWVWENKCAEESRLSPTFCHCVLPEQCGNRHVCVFVLVHVYPWNDEIQLDLSETRVDLLLPQGGDDSAWRSSSSLPSVLAAACVCVCLWSKEAVVVFLCRDLASGSMCPVKTNATCLWFGHSTFCTCCSIFVFAVLLVFFGGWNIEGFLAQVECLSVRECVCESGSAWMHVWQTGCVSAGVSVCVSLHVGEGVYIWI